MAAADLEPRSLRLAESIYEWRWRLWIVVPVAASLSLLPMPGVVRVLLAVPILALVLAPSVLRLIGNFAAGLRGR